MSPNLQAEDPNRDLGFGSRIAEERNRRLLNRDGSFNVRRKGSSFLRSNSMYHMLLTVSWTRFYLLILSFNLGVNLLFASGYMLCGERALAGGSAIGLEDRFVEAFFFSVQTSATIGYGRISPEGIAANILVSVEALVGLLGFALATGLLFARFSRPGSKFVYSDKAVIAPYHETTAFEFRVANERKNELAEVQATVTLSRFEQHGGKQVRKDLEAKRGNRIAPGTSFSLCNFLPPFAWFVEKAIIDRLEKLD